MELEIEFNIGAKDRRPVASTQSRLLDKDGTNLIATTSCQYMPQPSADHPRTLTGTEKAQEIESSKLSASDASIRSDG